MCDIKICQIELKADQPLQRERLRNFMTQQHKLHKRKEREKEKKKENSEKRIIEL